LAVDIINIGLRLFIATSLCWQPIQLVST